jgi:SAM-dependent methyltransferase
MARDHDHDFDPGAYWASRVGEGADLAAVGHRSMGPVYNREIYARRIEVLEDCLHRNFKQSVRRLRVLDIGCGSGFYTEYWKSRGVTEYTGLDISARSVAGLSAKYPTYKFIHADVSEPLACTASDGLKFDVITVFDVLYHIVDDQRFEAAVSNIASLVRAEGHVLVMDQLCVHDYQILRHVRCRARDRYLATFDAKALTLVEREPLFHFLVPPITTVRMVDYLSAGVFRVIGSMVRRSDRLSAWLSSRLRRFDIWLNAKGIRVPNSEFLVFGKRK